MVHQFFLINISGIRGKKLTLLRNFVSLKESVKIKQLGCGMKKQNLWSKGLLVAQLLAALLWLPTIASAFTQAERHSPVGYWLTIDDKTHQPRSVIQITENHKSGKTMLVGHLVAGLYVKGLKWRTQCTNCVAPFANKSLMGMRILWRFHARGKQWDSAWTNGQLFDVDSNKNIYRGKLWLDDNGMKMQVRGYAFLFFRTQVWQRLSLAEVKHYQQLMQQQLKAHPVQ